MQGGYIYPSYAPYYYHAHLLYKSPASTFFPTSITNFKFFASFMTAISSSISSQFSGENGYAEIDWDTIGFGLTPTDYMYTMKCSKDEEFTGGKLIPYGNIELSPAAGVLNYGQGLFEGMKAIRREDGKIVLFRPDENALRMRFGAERMCMPSPSVDHFIDAVKQTALANKRWIPPPGKGSLYIRPLLLGTGPILGLSPAPEYTFLIYASPVRNYFKEGSSTLNLYVEDQFDRASRGGSGGVKSITNYAPVLKPIIKAKDRGFSDVLYLDSVNGKYIEEVSSCNIFLVKVEERQIAVEELLEADEVFCTGTAVVVVPVGSITYQGKRVEYNTKEANSVYERLLSTFVAIQNGQVEDIHGWLVEIN